jgi:hypothetical protein
MEQGNVHWMVTAGLLLLVVFSALTESVVTRPAHAANPLIASSFFAPYTDVSIEHDLVQMSKNTGTKLFTLAFIVSQSSTNCQAAWYGVQSSINQGYALSDINQLRALGGDVIVSFGGASGTELGLACNSVSALQTQYQSVINEYHLTHLDFDIEGGTESDQSSVDRRNKAIANLQAAAKKAGKPLTISYTLPVDTAGLTQDDINLLKDAVRNGVKVGIVNIMAMDYYDPQSAPPNQMGLNAIKATANTYLQLHSIYPAKSASQLTAMIGITPMIGENDDTKEIFTENDARQVLAFAVRYHVGELSFWSVTRDQPCTNSSTVAQPTCSGVTQQPFGYSHILTVYNRGPISSIA